MSCGWGYRCTVCNVDSPTDFNHGDEVLRKIYNSREMIRQLIALDWHIEVHFTWCDGDDTFNFLADHEGSEHSICLVNEYTKTEPL